MSGHVHDWQVTSVARSVQDKTYVCMSCLATRSESLVSSLTWFARCTSDHSKNTVHGPYANPELAFDALDWNPTCDIAIFSKDSK